MAQGTITLTNGSKDVVGIGTDFTTVGAGDFITTTIGGVPYTIAVDTVTDATNLVLALPFDGPTASGLGFENTGVNTMALATMGVTTQAQKALRFMIADQTNWRKIFGNEEQITIITPSGQEVTGMSWGYLSNLLKNVDLDKIVENADRAAASAVAAKTSETNAKNSETTAVAAANSATADAGVANAAMQSAEQAEQGALNAQTAAETARTGSETAEQNAREWAQQVNPENLLHKGQNLADLADRAAAWLNVRPIGATPLSGDPVNDYDATTKRWVVNYVGGGGGTGPTMNGVQNYGVGQTTLWHSRAFIPAYAVTADGQLLNRADWPELWAHAQMHSPVSDAEWLNSEYPAGIPNLRGKFSSGDGSTTFRVPDLNGVQLNSVKGLFGRGDGGSSGAYGEVTGSALPNITGSVGSVGNIYGYNYAIAMTRGNGAFRLDGVGGGRTVGSSADNQVISSEGGTVANFDAALSSPVYGRYNAAEVMPNAFKGVWIIRASGGFTAANTSWSVINSDAATPPSGTTVEGGKVASSYKTGTTDYAEASMVVRTTIGGQTAAKINIKRGSAETNYYLPADGAEHTIKDSAFRSVDTRDAIPMPGEAGLMQQNARDFRGIASYALLGSYPLGVSSAIMRGDQGWKQTSAALVGVLSSRNWNDNSGGDSVFQIGINRNGAGYKVAQPSGDTYYLSDVIKFRDERNTTVDANGFIKTASPVVKLMSDGTSEANEQAEGATTIREGVGVYRVSGVLGFNSSAEWGGVSGGFEIPRNANGLPLLWVDYEVEASGDIVLRTYHRVHADAPDFASNRIDGVSDMSPIDIPAGRWVDLRVQMPERDVE